MNANFIVLGDYLNYIVVLITINFAILAVGQFFDGKQNEGIQKQKSKLDKYRLDFASSKNNVNTTVDLFNKMFDIAHNLLPSDKQSFPFIIISMGFISIYSLIVLIPLIVYDQSLAKKIINVLLYLVSAFMFPISVYLFHYLWKMRNLFLESEYYLEKIGWLHKSIIDALSSNPWLDEDGNLRKKSGE